MRVFKINWALLCKPHCKSLTSCKISEKPDEPIPKKNCTHTGTDNANFIGLFHKAWVEKEDATTKSFIKQQNKIQSEELVVKGLLSIKDE